MRFVQRAAAIGLGVLACVSIAGAQSPAYPTQPIRLTVGYSAGGGTDAAARLFAQSMGPALGQPLVIENRAGAAGSIAAAEVMRSKPDGYRLLMIASGTFISAALSAKPPYDVQRDFTPIAMGAITPLVLIVGPSVAATNVDELIALARSKPGGLSYASDGIGGTQHLAGDLFNLMAKVQMRHVPYKGGAEATLAVASGQVDLSFASMPAALPMLQAGRFRALAVTSPKRTSLKADLPTLDESGLKGFDIVAWYAFIGPAGLPRPVVERLNAAVVAAAATPEVKDMLRKQVLEGAVGTPEELATYFREQHTLITRLGKEANIKLE